MKNERKAKISMSFWFSLLVLIENALAIGVSTVAVTVLNQALGKWVNIEPAVLVFLFSIAIGVILAFLMNRLFLTPVKKLYKSMATVAKGDFSVRILEKSAVRELNNMYSNFNVMVEELGALETVQSDFVSNVSHEFKTPINAIEGYSMLLQNSENSKEQQSVYIDKILYNTKKLSNLVGNILLLAKLDNQSIQAKFNKFRLDEQIRQSILSQELQWVEKEIELDVELAEIEYYGSEELLTHVWGNLLSNAIKFSPKGGVVKMRLTDEGECLVFTIQDDGEGVSDSVKKHIFDKFYQGDGAHKEEGNGLGLALAKQIVEVNNGQITVMNAENGGAIFKVQFSKVKDRKVKAAT